MQLLKMFLFSLLCICVVVNGADLFFNIFNYDIKKKRAITILCLIVAPITTLVYYYF
jgi:hypothetical protein